MKKNCIPVVKLLTKKYVKLGATRGLEVERRTRNWAIRVQFPPGANNFSLAWVLCRGHLFTGFITWADLWSVTRSTKKEKLAAPSSGSFWMLEVWTRRCQTAEPRRTLETAWQKAPDDKALDEKGQIRKAWTRRCRKTEQDAYHESPATEAPVNKASDEKNEQQTERPWKNWL